jgi:hypothetical protein
MTELSSNSVRQLLAKWKGGDQKALRQLVPLLDAELCRPAHHYLQGENPSHTLESGALVYALRPHSPDGRILRISVTSHEAVDLGEMMLGALGVAWAEPGISIVFSREVNGLRPTDPRPGWPRFLRSLCMGRLQKRLWMTLVANVNRALCGSRSMTCLITSGRPPSLQTRNAVE